MPYGKDRYDNSRDKGGGRNAGQGDFSSMPENLWRAKVVPTNDFEFCSPPESLVVERGDFVVIPTRYGNDLARLLGPVVDKSDIDVDSIKLINRVATAEDLLLREQLEEKEEIAYQTCRRKIDDLGLVMKLVSAHYILNEQKVIFFFTAENRIDFRELVKDLVSTFKMRIELRQIGVRDESRVIGGVAVCGRQYCCHGLTDRLSPVSIKMAKDQNLSLNSLKISGPCGRLLCCLAFAHEHYTTERRNLPHEGMRLSFEGSSFKVAEVNIFTRTIHLIGPEGRRMNVPGERLSRRSGGGWEILPDNTEISLDGTLS